MKYFFGTIILVSLFVSSCRKNEKLPEEVKDEPVFYFDGLINGKNEAFEAGNDGYYMHASHYFDTTNLFVFKGNLNKQCAGPCGYSLTVLINDQRLSSINQKPNIDSALHTGAYYLQDRSLWPSTQNVFFKPVAEKSDIGFFSWKFKEETTSTEATNTYTVNRLLQIGKTYSVEMLYDDGVGGCSNTLTNVFNIGGAFQTQIRTVRQINPLQIQFEAITDKSDTYVYAWDFGDGETSNQKVVTHQFEPEKMFLVTLNTTNDKGESSLSYYQISTASTGPCEANFTAQFMPLNFDFLFKSITIIVTDPSGKQYSSANTTQPPAAFANIISVSDYQKNANGDPTKRVKLNFSCVLSNGTEQITVTQATAAIAVSYKN